MGAKKRKNDAQNKALNELYALDYEDIIGDMPVRFKYKEVDREDYGLDAREILLADDKELTQLIPLKKMAPYREQPWIVPRRKQAKFRAALQKRILERLKEQGLSKLDRSSVMSDEDGESHNKSLQNVVTNPRL